MVDDDDEEAVRANVRNWVVRRAPEAQQVLQRDAILDDQQWRGNASSAFMLVRQLETGYAHVLLSKSAFGMMSWYGKNQCFLSGQC